MLAILQKKALADLLADTLHMFSLDLVKVVRCYVTCADATAHAKAGLLQTIGSKGEAEGQFTDICYGIACSPDNTLWFAGLAKIQIFSSEGQFLKLTPNRLNDACGIAFAANGDAYIADCSVAGHCVVVCRPDGSFLRQFGSKGSMEGLLFSPFYLAIDTKQELIYLTEYGNNRVSVMQLDGKFVRMFGQYGFLDGNLNHPIGIALSAAGELGIADHSNHRIQVFTDQGVFLRKFGTMGAAAGQLINPCGMTVDGADNWIIADKGNHRVAIFKPNGEFITSFGDLNGSGEPGELDLPRCVCIDRDARILVSDEHFRVRVFGFAAPDF